MPNTTTGATVARGVISPVGTAAADRRLSIRARLCPSAASVGVSARLAAMPVTITPTARSPSAARTAGMATITNANSLPWASRKPSCTEPGVDQPNARAAMATSTALSAIRAARNTHDLRPVSQEDAPIERHPDRDEEEAEQQSAKRPRLGLDHVAIRRLGDDHAAQERAERERKTGAAGSGRRRPG